VEQLKAQPTAEDVQSHLERLADPQTTFETEENRKAESGDAVVIDFVGRRDGTEFDGGSAKDFQLVLGSGSFIPGFEDQLVGVTAGQHLEVNVTFPESYGAEELAGQGAVFEVDVKEVKRPEAAAIDDEFATKMGLENLKELKKTLTDQIKSDYDRVGRNRVKRKLLDELVSQYEFEVPTGLVDAEFDAIWQQFGEQIAKSEGEESEAGKSEEEFKADYKEIAERRVRLGLLLSEVGGRNNIEVNQEELNRAMAEQARKYPGQEREFIQHLQDNPDAMGQLRAPIFEDKVVDFILEMVTVTEREVTPEELLHEPEDDEPEEKPKAKSKAKAKPKDGSKPKSRRKKKTEKKEEDGSSASDGEEPS
jgi:trigger factor